MRPFYLKFILLAPSVGPGHNFSPTPLPRESGEIEELVGSAHSTLCKYPDGGHGGPPHRPPHRERVGEAAAPGRRPKTQPRQRLYPDLHQSNCPDFREKEDGGQCPPDILLKATAESQKNAIRRGAQNDQDALIQSAMIFGNSYNCRQQTFPISSGNRVLRKTASIVE